MWILHHILRQGDLFYKQKLFHAWRFIHMQIHLSWSLWSVSAGVDQRLSGGGDKLTPLPGRTGLISARCYCIFMTTFPQTQKVKQECLEYVSLVLLRAHTHTHTHTHTHRRTLHLLLLWLANRNVYLLNPTNTLTFFTKTLLCMFWCFFPHEDHYRW